jgi:transcription initiation factor TFIID TATA-box-binding protein
MQGSSQTKDQGSSQAPIETCLSSIKPDLTIQNVVSTFFLGRKKLNLKAICSRARYLEFNPHKFAAATLRLKHPRCTSLIFGSGNMVCTGGKSESDSRFACRQCVNILQRSGLKVGFCNYKVQNIVGSTSLTKPIDLIQLQKDFGPYTSYEPELFPGLVFRLRKPKIVFLLFRSGRLVVTGAKTEEQIHKYWDGFYNVVLKQYLDTENDLRCSSEYRIKNSSKDYNTTFFYDALS